MNNFKIIQRFLLVYLLGIIFIPTNVYGQVPLTTTEQQTDVTVKPRVMSQYPGGISNGLRLWLRADDESSFTFNGVNANSEKYVSIWRDQTLNHVDYDYATVSGMSYNQYPVYRPYEEKANFFPSVYFNAWAFLATPASKGPLSQKTFPDLMTFVNYFATSESGEKRLYFMGIGSTEPGELSSDYPAIGFKPENHNGRLYFRSSGGALNGSKSTDLFEKNSTAIQMTHIHAGEGTTNTGFYLFNFGGRIDKTIRSSKTFANSMLGTSGGTLGGASIGPGSATGNKTASGSFIGLLSDVIVYETRLSDSDVEKVNTYLGIKYGITLDRDETSADINYDYVLSGGESVWNGDDLPNKKYHNNVAGIVRDDNSLFVNKSKSTSGEGMIGMMTQSHAVKGQGSKPDPEFVNDQSGLFWGDDMGKETITFKQSADECFEFTERTSRVWLVQKTNLNKMPVTIFAGVAGAGDLDNYMNARYQAYLLVAKSKEDLDNKIWDMVVPGYFDPTDKYHKFDYTFTDKYTYFTLAFKSLGGGCESCTFKGMDNFTFTRKNIGNKSSIRVTGGNSVTLSNLNTDNGYLNIKNIIFEADKGVKRMRIKPNGKRKAVNISSTGAANAKSRIIYELSTPASVSFAIGDIDLHEVTSVYALCNTDTVYPENVYREPLTGKYRKKGYSFTYKGSTGTGNGAQSPGRGNPRGILHFDFGFAIEKIVIEYRSTKGSTRFLDLFPMQFYCPQPLPPPNEAGYAMQKQGSYEIEACEVIDYKFTILNANANCDSSRVHFEDILPPNMQWLPKSLSFNGELLDTKIEDKGGQSIIINDRTLVIDSLMLPGMGTKTVIRAQAILNEDAPINMTYYNQNSITYLRKDNGTSESLLSTDMSFIEGVDTDRRTPTKVANNVRDYKYLTAKMSYKPSQCFRENNEIEVTLEINNPNVALSQVYLDLEYDENFNYKPGSFKINGNTVSGIKEMIEVDEDGDEMLGYTTVSGINLPNGLSTITYIIKVPPLTKIISKIDPVTGAKVYDSLYFGFDLNTEAENSICLENAFLFTNGDDELPYCTSLKYIITNRNVTNVITK